MNIIAKQLPAEQSRTFLDGSKRSSVTLRSCAVGLGTYRPGWKWSLHAGAQTGKPAEHHIGYILSGRMMVVDAAGVGTEVGPGCAFEIPPGHDGWVLGDVPCVALDFTALSLPSANAGADQPHA